MTRITVVLLVAVALGSGCTGSRVAVDVPLEELEARAEQDSVDAVAQYNLAIGYWAQDDFARAEVALRNAARLDPRFAQAYLALGFLPYAQRPALWEEVMEDRVPHEWVDALAEADENYRRAIMIDPLVDMRILGAVTPPIISTASRFYDAWFRGFDDYRNGNYAATFGRYDRLIGELETEWRRDARRHMPDVILLHRGLAAAHLGRWDIAVGDLRIIYDRWRAAENEEEFIHVPLETNHYRYILGVLLALSGQTVEAEVLLRDAAIENLGLYMAHVRLASIAEARGDMRLALEERQRAINANPGDPTLYLDQGLTYANAGMLDQAEASIEQALSLRPRDAQILYFLGVVRAMKGDAPGARESLERFLAIAPARFGAEIDDARTRLEGLR